MNQEFDHYADDYKNIMDACTGSLGQEAKYFLYYKSEYLQRLFLGTSPKKILDFGCGIGQFSKILTEAFPTAIVHGYDISPKSIEVAHKEARENLTFTSNLEDLDNDYDLIVIANVMHHIPLDRREASITELWGRIQAGGKAVVFEHNPLNPFTRWVVNRCAFDADAVLLRPNETIGYFSKRKALTRRDYIVFFPKIVEWLKILEPSIRWLPLGAQYTVVATK